MFKKKDPADEEFERIVREMASLNPESDEYRERLDTASELMKLRPQKAKPAGMEPLIDAAGKVLVVLLVIGFERANVWTSSIKIPTFGRRS